MSKVDDYIEARELSDWIREAMMCLDRGESTEAKYWLDQAFQKAVAALMEYERTHDIHPLTQSHYDSFLANNGRDK